VVLPPYSPPKSCPSGHIPNELNTENDINTNNDIDNTKNDVNTTKTGTNNKNDLDYTRNDVDNIKKDTNNIQYKPTWDIKNIIYPAVKEIRKIKNIIVGKSYALWCVFFLIYI
jgi:hypothetical protein